MRFKTLSNPKGRFKVKSEISQYWLKVQSKFVSNPSNRGFIVKSETPNSPNLELNQEILN